MEEKLVNTYEISFLISLPESAESVKSHLGKFGAEIVLDGPVAPIQLSYPIKKQQSAYFGYIHFKMPKENIAELNGALQLDSKVLRVLIITPPAEKPKPRTDFGKPSVKKAPVANDISNEALEAKLAALQGSN